MFGADAQQLCRSCKQLQAVSEFNFRRRASNQRYVYCRTCQRAWNRAHYQKNRATYIANAKRHNREYNAANLKRIADYLFEHPCVDCAERDIVVLHFDHRDRGSKRMAIGDLLRYSSWSAIEAEIAKCDVRCANDHARRTAKQFGWRKLALLEQGRQGSNLQTSRFGDERSAN